MDLKLVKKIIDMISESSVDEVSIEEGDFKIKVKKKAEAASQAIHYAPPQPQPQQAAPSPAAPQQQVSATETKEKDEGSADGEVVKSPIVGTFYEAASPDSDPFVKPGDSVKQGDPLCIIEAMKIMNEIEAEFDGVVQKILVDNAQPVEFDQPLFIIKKA